MQSILRIGAMVAALTVAAPAAAQQQQGRVGIGLGMPTNQFFDLLTVNGGFEAPQIFVPISLGANLRLEPQLGYFKISDDQDNTEDRSFTLGAGLFFVKPTTQQTQLYLGGRLAATWNRSEEPDFRDEWTNLRIAGAFGGEYLPSPWFSVGAEAQLAYTNVGDIDRKFTSGATATRRGGSVFSTASLLFLRVYFL